MLCNFAKVDIEKNNVVFGAAEWKQPCMQRTQAKMDYTAFLHP